MRGTRGAAWRRISRRGSCPATWSGSTRSRLSGTRIRTQIGRAYRRLRETHAHDREAFAREWRARAERWRFDEINELIRIHNEWYPVEANLPLNPRTGDYVMIRGRSYRRAPLGPEWVLEQFPP